MGRCLRFRARWLPCAPMCPSAFALAASYASPSLRRSVVLATALLACGSNGPTPLPFHPASPVVAPDPAVFGPYPVGVTTIVLEDPSRPKADGSPRRLLTEVWYPATEEARAALAVGIDVGAYYDVLTLATPAQQMSLGDARAPLLRTEALRGGVPRADRAPYPLVVFSHGQGGIRWQSTFFTVALASHGYVVVAPDHENNTLADGLADRLSSPIEGFGNRPADVSFLLDRFAPGARGGAQPKGVTAAASTLAGLPGEHESARDRDVVASLGAIVDVRRIGVAGHSFGALTGFRVAASDERVRALVVHAPPDATLAFIERADDFKLSIPVMVQGGGLDRTLPYDQNAGPAWLRTQKPHGLLKILTAGHFTFSDLCRFNLSTLAARVGFTSLAGTLGDGCEPPAPAAGLSQSLINHFSIGFFNATLYESAPSWLLLTQARANGRWAGLAQVETEY